MIFASAPAALRLHRALLPDSRPYALDTVVLKALGHAPLVVVAVFVDCIAREIARTWTIANSSSVPPDVLASWLLSIFVRCLPVGPFMLKFVFGAGGPPPAPLVQQDGADQVATEPVVIVGGGIGGVVLGLTLHKFRIPFTIIERYAEKDADGGADLALWPAASDVLKELGLGDESWWEEETYRVRQSTIATTAAASSASQMDEGSNNLRGSSRVLTTLDMDNVVGVDSVGFRLVQRRELLGQLRRLLPAGCITYNCTVEQLASNRDGVVVKTFVGDDDDVSFARTLRGRLAVGADGIKSTCRQYVVNGKDTAIRFGGETCYRGIIDIPASMVVDKLTEEEASSVLKVEALFEDDEEENPESFKLLYGEKTRSAWGYIDGKQTIGFWFLKQLGEPVDDYTEISKEWPEPLRTFAAASKPDDGSSYCHAITDRAPLSKWSKENVTLIGDACHSTTPNMGQGACMAIEDAFVLGVLLKEYWSKPDGHTEAFYQYERARRGHTAGVQAGSYKKMKLGQLTNPLLVAFRNFALSMLNPATLEKGLQAENMFNIGPWIERALRLYASSEEDAL